MLKTALRYILLSKLEGDYLEFGVFRGETLAAAFHLAARNKLKTMRFLGFDSFEGLPEPQGIDKAGTYQFESGEYRCDLSSVTSNLARQGVDLERVKFIPGWFNESLTENTRAQIQLRTAALVWVDCDLYESTVPVLEFILPHLQDGTVLVFDDWYCFRGRGDMGEQRALSEWLSRNPHISVQQYHRFGWHGNSFIVNFKDPNHRAKS